MADSAEMAELMGKTAWALASEVCNLNRENEAMRKALEDVANPIGALQRYAKEQGRQLDGHMAVIITKDPEHLKGIARAALASLKETEK